jgi:hypothetical protein
MSTMNPPPPGEAPDDHYQRNQRVERQRLVQRRRALEERTVSGKNGGRHGGVHQVRDVRVRVAGLTGQIDQAIVHGSRKHRTIPRWLRWLAVVPITTDFLIVVLYFAVVLNVRLDAAKDTPAEAVAAVIFALIISLGLFLALRWIAIRRRGYKNDAGHYETPDEPGAWLPRVELVLIGALLLGVAMVMLVRVFSDAQAAGVQMGAVWVVAGFLALITATLNWCLFLIEFSDGSEETHELDHWGKQLRRVDKEAHEIEARLRDVEARLARDGEEQEQPAA